MHGARWTLGWLQRNFHGDAVARHAWRGVNDGNTATREPVKKAAFTYVWSTNDGEFGKHDSPTL